MTSVTAGAVMFFYVLTPADTFGPGRAAAGWLLFAAALVVVTVMLLRSIADAQVRREGSRPGVAIAALIILTVFVFATAYLALSRHPGQLSGLDTRLDALYFTVVTLATVGYGDIVPTGQAARVVATLQIAYNLIFLTTAATVFSHHLRALAAARRPQRDDDHEGQAP
ncbi:potassium channel family protein [Streptomyces sp. 4N509B]|uniref:potassium channel family protein n=1 Tax=Streptomyces sp. 4N509B TaxID=3457413 RepID=UPI003FD3E8AF